MSSLRQFWSKYAGELIAGFIGFVLFGVLIFTFNHYRQKIDNMDSKISIIQNTIRKHHGDKWREVDEIVEARLLKKRVEKIGKTIDAILEWTKNADNIIIKLRGRGDTGYAHLTEHYGDTNEPIFLINRIHRAEDHYNVGEEIEVENLHSGRVISGYVRQKYDGKEDPDVLIQVNPYGAEKLVFTKATGKIKVKVKNKIMAQTRKWNSVQEILVSGLKSQ